MTQSNLPKAINCKINLTSNSLLFNYNNTGLQVSMYNCNKLLFFNFLKEDLQSVPLRYN